MSEGCVHRWKLETPEHGKELVEGVCGRCGARRLMRAWGDDLPSVAYASAEQIRRANARSRGGQMAAASRRGPRER